MSVLPASLGMAARLGMLMMMSSCVVAGILRILRGHIPELLRHPYAAAIVDDIYLCANGQQRNAMVAEFYAREYVLFEQVS